MGLLGDLVLAIAIGQEIQKILMLLNNNEQPSGTTDIYNEALQHCINMHFIQIDSLGTIHITTSGLECLQQMENTSAEAGSTR